MKTPPASLWLFFLIGTAARDLRTENNMKEPMETEPFINFHHSCMLQSFTQQASSSVHTLAPSDIQAVAAIGSLGNIGASRMRHADLLPSTQRSLIQTSMEALTALVRNFNPSVRHYPSPGNSMAALQNETSLLEQAEEIISSMKNTPGLDYENNWKLITIFYSCLSRASTSQEAFPPDSAEEVEKVLDFLQEQVPKAFVNLVDSSVLAVLSDSPMDDNNNRDASPYSCICSSECSRLDDVVRRWTYQDALEKLLASRRYEQKDDFTVVSQTPLQEAEGHFTENGAVNANSPNRTSVEISSIRFSLLGVELWNNMMEPVGQKKPYHFSEMPKAQCPSQPLSFGTSIPCSDLSPSNTVPSSVHELRPADIKVIGALGDSITAGNGAASSPYNLLGVLTQYRGLSWSVGGNENINTVTTLANILREFNPSLIGFSTGKGKEHTTNAQLNQAVAGSHAEDVPSQARRLIALMKNDPKINFQEDWKLVTLFIGGNDLCDSCKDAERYSPEKFVSNIQEAFDILHEEVPRLFVNLVTILHIRTLGELYREKSIYCPRLIMSEDKASLLLGRSLCPCVLNYDDNSPEIEVLEATNRKYQEGTRRLIESGRYDTREDFTVVVQPFMEGTIMPKTKEGLPDASYFAPDCFHFQQKTHSQAARALWNNMLEPLGEKLNAQALEAQIALKCPSLDQPFLRTRKNSNYTYPTQDAA